MKHKIGAMCHTLMYLGLNPKALRPHVLRFLGPKTMLCKAFGLFELWAI